MATLDEILSLVQYWQQRGTWAIPIEMDKRAAEHSEAAFRLLKDAEGCRRRGDEQMATRLEGEAMHERGMAGQCRQFRADTLAGLMRIESFVRENRPELIELVREIRLAADADSAILGMARLESRLRCGAEDITLVTAKQLGDHAGCGDKTVREALLEKRCSPDVESAGRNGGHKWRYSKAVDALKTIDNGILKGAEWPESAAELTTRKDSSKIPAKTSKR